MKDARVRYNAAEKLAITRFAVRCFCLCVRTLRLPPWPIGFYTTWSGSQRHATNGGRSCMQSTSAASTGSRFEDQCRGLPCCPGAVVHPFVHPFGRDGQIPSHELDGSPPLNSQNTTEANHVDTPVRPFKVVARVRIPLGVLLTSVQVVCDSGSASES